MSELIGHIVSRRYRIETFLGKGGMAEVYKVWDEERSVYLAMKILYADLAEDKVFLRRFKREAQTLSKLQHPNIVRFYGLEQDGNLVFILMDYVEGSTLRKEIFQSNVPFAGERILEIFRPVCAALYYAHKLGFVHCDVKPANIMIHKNGTVYVSDFGIARMTESSTATMVGAGTPAYMAPELARGEEPVPQTDIYASGVVLFELLTGGDRPFTGENAKTTGSTSEKVRWEQMQLNPPPPSKFNSSITSAIDAIVLKCLDKAPTSRYLSTMDLLNELTECFALVIPTSESTLGSEPLKDSGPAIVPKKSQSNEIKQEELELRAQVQDRLGPDQRESAEQKKVPQVVRKPRRKNRIIIGLGVIASLIGLGVITVMVFFLWMGLSNNAFSINESIPIVTPTKTSRPTVTPLPTRTPNLAATQQVGEWDAETQEYFKMGYLKTNQGKLIEYADFSEEWAQLGWYQRWILDDKASDFYMSAHFKWSSAYRSADSSGCGFVFAEQENGYHYSVFLDRSRVFFFDAEYYYEPIGTTRGTGRVNFGNPFDKPVEADFTLIVSDIHAYVLVDGELVGEYTLSQSKNLQGNVGVALLSGTNKDYGTRCEMTNLHLWIPKE